MVSLKKTPKYLHLISMIPKLDIVRTESRSVRIKTDISRQTSGTAARDSLCVSLGIWTFGNGEISEMQ